MEAEHLTGSRAQPSCLVIVCKCVLTLRWAVRLNVLRFLNWSLPHQILQSLRARNRPCLSPRQTATALAGVKIITPGHSPASSTALPSSLAEIQDLAQSLKRARLFLQGQHADLIKSMSKKDQEVISSWLYEFWFFGFKTAKYWGRGPLFWDAESLAFSHYMPRTPKSIPSSPGMDAPSPSLQKINLPPSLCHYTIHCHPDAVFYDAGAVIEPEISGLSQDPFDERSWKPWSDINTAAPFEQRLVDGLETNAYTSRTTESLPITVAPIIEACQSPRDRFLEEGLGFSIIGRNEELVESILKKIDVTEVNGIYPLHLATSYLDGSRTCCNILDELLRSGSWEDNNLSEIKNNIGQNVIDNLFVTILRSHTSMTPGDVDNNLRGERRFPGEEVDICGRWDADSDCFRALVAAGISSVPVEWKHKFCHTSVHTIYHCITALCLRQHDILDYRSELFSKYCESCGLRAQLYPPHMAVITAFHLAQSGTKDEDLFGILALILCMRAWEVNFDQTAILPLSLYFEDEPKMDDMLIDCHHQDQTAYQMATSVPQHYVQGWSEQVQIGWQVICLVLRAVTDANRDEGEDENEKGLEDSFACDHCTYVRNDRRLRVRRNKHIGKLWAAVQVELLTYRRQSDTDPWLSANFSITEVLRSLQSGDEMSTGRITSQALMGDHCRCGDFGPIYPRAEEVSRVPFSNLENSWDLLKVIPPCYYD